jgi:hypothetical protein
VIDAFRPKLSPPGPFARTVMSPHRWPRLESVVHQEVAVGEDRGRARDDGARVLADVDGAEHVEAAGRGVTFPPFSTVSAPYVPGARSQRLLPGLPSMAPAQSESDATLTMLNGLHGGNCAGMPQAISRSPESVTHWPPTVRQLGTESPSAIADDRERGERAAGRAQGDVFR